MVASTCVVTGGAGFIGCAISSGLVQRFQNVIVLDALLPQIHAHPIRPAALNDKIEFWHADIKESQVWDRLLAKVRPDVVVHLAAETGTGQSLTEASRHGQENVIGTTVMLDALARHKHRVEHIILMSSRAVYGEGAWRRPNGELFYPGQRSRAQLSEQLWDFPSATHQPFSVADTVPHPTSIYGATKLAQEHILQAWALSFGSNLSILRLQNVYGPGQSLINAYTGIVSLFARIAREKKSIPLYEDGAMLRDFIFITDVSDAILATIDSSFSGCRHLDVGAGLASTIRDVAELMAERYAAAPPHVSAQYRFGDVRHASCDITATLDAIKWRPMCSLRNGLDALCKWVDAELQHDGSRDTSSDRG